LIADTAQDFRKGHGPVKNATCFTRIALGQRGHKGADIDMEWTGCGAKGLFLLNATGFKCSELRLFHKEVVSL
jgi:hypothetical protein